MKNQEKGDVSMINETPRKDVDDLVFMDDEWVRSER